MFEYDVLTNKDYQLVKTGTKKFYNTDGQTSLSDFLKNTTDESFVTLVSDGNSTEKNLSFVHFTTEPVKNNNRRYKVGVDNLHTAVTVFTVRKLINPKWVDMKDEYLVPNINFSWDTNFVADSLIYSLFNSSSGQKSTTHNNNELFWVSVEKMRQLGDNHGYDELYNNARISSDRFVYKLLYGEKRIYDKLSPDAKLVIDKAIELVEKSIEIRQHIADDDNNLDSWDCGYAQLKMVWKEYFQEDFTEFRRLYKVMEDRMRPLVYELGFLMK